MIIILGVFVLSIHMLCDEYRKIAHRLLSETATDIDKKNLIPATLLNDLRNEGFFSPGKSDLADLLCRIRSLAFYSPGVAHSVLVNASAWLAAGRPEEEGIYALSVTEPGGGTDIRSSLKTSAHEDKSGVFITGEKIFTSNAPYADYFIVLALGSGGPTLYMVPRSENVTYDLLEVSGLRGTGASIVRYRNARGKRIGIPGKGLKESLSGINLGRLGYAAIALGIADSALSIIVKTGTSKTIFGKQLIDYQGIKWRIASIYSRITLLETLVSDQAEKSKDNWIIDPTKASIAKNEGAKLAQDAAWAASQILGGRGLELWSLTERMQRDARALDIGEGAREVLLDFIASKAVKAYSSL